MITLTKNSLRRRALLRCYFATQENDWTAARATLDAATLHWREESAHTLAMQGVTSCQNGNIKAGIDIFQEGLRVLSSSSSSTTTDGTETLTRSPTARHLYNCLGLAKQTQSNYSEAETNLQSAFDLCDRPETLGMGDDQFLDRTGLLVDLAANHMYQGALDQADKLLRRCHYTATRAYRPSPELVATVLANQGELEWLRNNTTRAQQLMEDARDMLAAAPSVPCDSIDGTSFDLLIQSSLARYALSLGNLKDAAKCIQNMETSMEKTSMEKTAMEKSTLSQHLFRGRLYTQRGLLSSLEGQHDQAKEMHDHAYAMFNTYDDVNVDVAIAMHNKGIYSNSKKEAEELFIQASTYLKRVPDQRMYKATLSNLTVIQSEATSTTAPTLATTSTSAMVLPVHLPKLNTPMFQLNHTVPLTGLAVSMLPHRTKFGTARAFSTSKQTNMEETEIKSYKRLQHLPRVRPSSELLGATFWDESERIAVKKHKNKSIPRLCDRVPQSNIKMMLDKMSTHDAMEGIDHISTELKQVMIHDLKNVPHSSEYHPYEQAIIDLTLGPKFPQQKNITGDGKGLLKYDELIKRAKNLAYKRVDEATNALRKRSNKGVVRRKHNKNEKQKGGVGWNLLRDGKSELESVITGKKDKNEWDHLGIMIGKLRDIPSVYIPKETLETELITNHNTMCPPVVLVGAPNVGKSSLVSLISSKQPEVNHYPFTTRGILIGNMEWNDQQKLKCQIMDTPGLLHRPIQERNNIELLTLASLSYLPACVVLFVTDLTESSTVSHEEQILLRAEVYEKFGAANNVKGWVDVCGKSDMDLNASFQSHIDSSFLVSCHEDNGIDELTAKLRDILGSSNKQVMQEHQRKHRDYLRSEKFIEIENKEMMEQKEREKTPRKKDRWRNRDTFTDI